MLLSMVLSWSELPGTHHYNYPNPTWTYVEASNQQSQFQSINFFPPAQASKSAINQAEV
ncbi:hypothetical protein CROQUDRAFT_660611, partial [Cronartium quercuum f. sp. fusiforme G11]